jgi:glutamate/tyrosine decarboxylase-like PLP-dependent enzyme
MVKEDRGPRRPLKPQHHPPATRTHNPSRAQPTTRTTTTAPAAALRQVLHYSMRTSHPLFYNQLYARVEPAGLAAEWLAAATNTNVHTFEVAPVYTMLENEVISKMAKLVGFEEAAHDGLFVPGGSASNLYALHIARHRAFPEVRTKGLGALPQLVAFTSVQSHYSYTKVGLVTDGCFEYRIT